mmetsp:Transcript_2923/g.6557  ORF Transcript_2923/g.6557 Transcript_2923/m.6557 type:complete len:965 (+) Transcript_2923:121-3015(+)
MGGPEWSSTLRAHRNRALWEQDQVEARERLGEADEVTEGGKTRYVHSSLQASFDRQSEQECRHLVYPNLWPKAQAVDDDFEVPGKIKIRRDAWQVESPASDPLPEAPEGYKEEGGWLAWALDRDRHDLETSPYRAKERAAAELKARQVAEAQAEAEAERRAKKSAKELAAEEAAKKKADAAEAKRVEAAAKKVKFELDEANRLKSAADLARETELLRFKEAEDKLAKADEAHEAARRAVRGAVTDPLVDYHAPSNWFGVKTGVRLVGSAELLRVTELNLAKNGLKGEIPHAALEKLRGLELLDLSFQSFVGVRPPGHERNVEEAPVTPAGRLFGWVLDGRNAHMGGKDLKASPGQEKGAQAFGGGKGAGAKVFGAATRKGLGGLPNLTSLDLSHNVLSGPLPGGEPKPWPPLDDLAEEQREAEERKLRVVHGEVAGVGEGEAGKGLELKTPPPLAGDATPEPRSPPPLTAVARPLGLACAASLRVLSLARNRLTGPLPLAMSELGSLEHLRLEGNLLTGPVTQRLVEGWPRLNCLRLGANQLTGPLPDLAKACPQLEVISLENNCFSGPAPPGLGACLRLEALLLSRNRLLTGTLPLGEWLKPRPCPACFEGGFEGTSSPRSASLGLPGALDLSAMAPLGSTRSPADLSSQQPPGYPLGEYLRGHGPRGCGRCVGGRVQGMQRLVVLGIEHLVRVNQRQVAAAHLREALPRCRVYLEPFLPEYTPESADAEDAALWEAAREERERAAAKAEAERMKRSMTYEKLAEKEREAARIAEAPERAVEDVPAEEGKAEEEEAKEEVNPRVAAWRAGASQGDEACAFQLALAHELGLFGLVPDIQKAMDCLKPLAPDPEGDPEGNPEGGRQKGGSEVAAQEVARLAEAAHALYMAGDGDGPSGPGEPEKNQLLGLAGSGEEEESEAAKKKKNLVKVEANPTMQTFATSIYSPLLDHSYERQVDRPKGWRP